MPSFEHGRKVTAQPGMLLMFEQKGAAQWPIIRAVT